MQQNSLIKKTVTIANGATDSSIIKLNGALKPVALDMPAAFTGTTVKILCSSADPFGPEPAIGTFKPASDSVAGAETFAVAAGKYVVLHRAVAANWIAIQSGSAEGGARTIEVIMQGI